MKREPDISDQPARLALIVAAAENGVIGRDGHMPWRMSSDLKHFRAMTMGKPVIMGRKTFQSLGKPLAGRDNIVITRDPSFVAEGAITAGSLEAALAIARTKATESGVNDIMVIGGAEIYRLALPLCQRIYLTRIHASPEGDTSFPALDPASWRQAGADPCPAGPRDDHAATFYVFDRISKS